MTIKELIKQYSENEIIDIVTHVLGKNKTWVLVHADKKLSDQQLSKIRILIRQFKTGKPLAYLFGYKHFYGLKFKVTKDTLIPRPETELLVDQAALLIKNKSIKSVLDIGTGSGCIIISIAKSLPKGKYNFMGSDTSGKVLAIAKQNAKTHKVKIKFLKSYLLDETGENFDLIIANLPYLDITWKNDSIKFEPKQALFAGKNGLALIERLLNQISEQKNKPKYMLLEFDPRQKQDLSKLIKKYLAGAETKFHRDYAGRFRLAIIKI